VALSAYDLSFVKPGVRPQVIQGMTLGNLLRVLARNDFRVDPECTGRLAYLLVLGVFNSIYGACETVFSARQIRTVEIDPPPLFILGHWRSGTTHLHNLLSLDENLTSPTAFQSLFPHHFLFTGVGAALFNWVAPGKRPMDNMAFSADTPHEDEFALAAHSTVSPYMKFLFPVTGDDGYSEMDPKRLPKEALERWKDSLVLFMKKLSLSNRGRIVLKSPPHLGRVSTLLEIFPRAQFVHIVRDPYRVYLSTRKLWTDGLSAAHLQIPQPESVDELILSWYVELFSLFEKDRELVPAGSLYEMKFEDLEAEPIKTLRGMYAGLGLSGFEPFEERLEIYMKSIGGYEKNSYHMSEADREKVRRVWGNNFERYGYRI
jgi:omega-hydroxy-beta-dihydromenaquinone-9 sulfotransferase